MRRLQYVDDEHHAEVWRGVLTLFSPSTERRKRPQPLLGELKL
jgi:hypothetical protein